MNRSDWHVFALAVFVSPLAVTGLGLAISRGHGEAIIVAVMVVGSLIAYLSRHRIPAAQALQTLQTQSAMMTAALTSMSRQRLT
jgi:hypothetical protein